MVIYVDVLIFINIIINYCILSVTKKFLALKSSQLRLIIASFISALFSLSVFLPECNIIISLLIKISCAFAMCIIAFEYSGVITYIKGILTTFMFSVIFCAALIMIYQIYKPKNMAIINDTIYIHINPILLITISIVIYLIIILLQRILHQNTLNSSVLLKIIIQNIEYNCIGKVDTGNSVIEPFSGSPVIITEKSVLKDLNITKPRIIPYKALGTTGVLYAVKANKVFIDNKEIDKEIYIAIYNGEIDQQYKAIINSKILR